MKRQDALGHPGRPAALVWALLSCFAAQAAAQDVEKGAEPELRKYELKVVGIYRSVELKGRTVATPREVYLQPLSASGPLEALVGQTLDVFRPGVPVPASVDFVDTPKAKAKTGKKKKRKKRRRPRKKSKAAAKLAAAKKAAAPAEVAPKAPPRPEAERVERLAPRPVKTVAMEVMVGKVKVVAVRSGVVVANAHDTPEGAPAVAGTLPAVMAGDLARLEVAPPAPPPPPSLTPAEKSVLDADRKVTEKEDHRRRNPPKKYKRAKMRWKL